MRVASALLVALLCASCAGSRRAAFTRDGFAMSEPLWEDDEKAIKARSSFDLSCPAESLTLQVLTLVPRSEFASQVGVTGCGKKAVYVIPNNRYGEGWIAN